jgi:hypothetical protein
MLDPLTQFAIAAAFVLGALALLGLYAGRQQRKYAALAEAERLAARRAKGA